MTRAQTTMLTQLLADLAIVNDPVLRRDAEKRIAVLLTKTA